MGKVTDENSVVTNSSSNSSSSPSSNKQTSTSSGPQTTEEKSYHKVKKTLIEPAIEERELRPTRKSTEEQRAKKKEELKKKVILPQPDFIAEFQKLHEERRSASSYNEIDNKSLGKTRVAYRRSRDTGAYPDIKNPNNKNLAEASRRILTDGGVLKPHNFGLSNTFGSQYSEKEINPDTNATRGSVDAEISKRKKTLDDNILNHKTKSVREIVEKLPEFHNPDEKSAIIVDPNQLAASYPCIMVRFNDDYPHHKKMKKDNVAYHYHDSYAKFLNHLLIACINKNLRNKNVGIYFNRRQSFGFLIPTSSDTGTSLRLSLGLVPNDEWKECVVDGIKEFNTLLKYLWDHGAISEGAAATNNADGEMGAPQAKFRRGLVDIYGHKLFLEKLLEEPNHEAELKDGESIHYKSLQTFIKTLGTDQGYVQIAADAQKDNHFKKLVELIKIEDQVAASDEFNQLFESVILLYKNLSDKEIDKIEAKILAMQALSPSEKMNALKTEIAHYQLRSVQELKNIDSIEITSESVHSDAPPPSPHRNDTDDILSLGKHYTPTGMSALFAPLVAFQEVRGGVVKVKREQYAYFELGDWDKSKKIEESVVNFVDTYDADIIYVDNNPCVTEATAPKTVEQVIELIIASNHMPKMLVVDTTSATEEQVKAIKKAWLKTSIPILCLAVSGLKHRQAGLDMAQYGENKLFFNNKNCKDTNLPEMGPEDDKGKAKAQAISMRVTAERMQARLRAITIGSSPPYVTKTRRDMRLAATTPLYSRILKDGKKRGFTEDENSPQLNIADEPKSKSNKKRSFSPKLNNSTGDNGNS